MASDRRTLSSRLKSIGQRAGLPDRDAAAQRSREPAVVVTPVGAPPAGAALDPAPLVAQATPADEQPTGDVPVVTAPSPAEQPTIAAPAIVDPFAQQAGPTLRPPVLPARAVETPASPQPQDDADDEPFSSRATIWPQTTPTLRFEPDANADADTDPSSADASPANLGASAAPVPAVPHVVAADAAGEPHNAVTGSHDSATPGPATTSDPNQTGRLRVLGGLRRRRGSGDASAADLTATSATPSPVRAASTLPADAPAAPQAAASSRDGEAARSEPTQKPNEPTAAAEPFAPPSKPSFSERAALRRRAKTLRARRDAGLLELGAIVLDQRRFGDPTGGSLQRRRTDELGDLDRELAAIEQVLDDDGPAETVAQLGIVRCRSCTALVGPRDRFCTQCGTARPDDAGTAASGS